MPLYNSSEVFVPAKQYGNTIHKKTERNAQCARVHLWSHLQVDCSQSPIFSWDRLDIPRLTVTRVLLFGGGRSEKTAPAPLSSFDTHARWQPVTQSARSRWSYGKMSNLQANSLFSMHNNWPLYLLKPYVSFILKLFLPLTFTVFVRIHNTFRKIKVVQVICIMFRDKWIILFSKFSFCGDFSLHLHEMVQFKKHQETSRKLKIYKGMIWFLKLANIDINTSDMSCSNRLPNRYFSKIDVGCPCFKTW